MNNEIFHHRGWLWALLIAAGPVWAEEPPVAATEPAGGAAVTPSQTAPMAASPQDESFHLSAIRFEGNRRTREQILRQEMRIREGDYITAREVAETRQAIMDLGLFESVEARLDEAPDGKVLVLDMEEKFFFLPVPLVNGDVNTGDYSYGLELRVDNLGGLNQRVKIVYEEERSPGNKEVTYSKQGSVSYLYPRVEGTPYTLALSYRLTQEDFNVLTEDKDDIIAEYHRNITSVGTGISRWLQREGPSRGWFGGMGLNYQQHQYNFLTGIPDLYETSQAISVSAHVGNTDVHDHGYYNTGSAFGWNGELGDESIGSDYDFSRHLFYYRTYYHFAPTANLNWQLRIGFADGKPFNGLAYSVGGYTTLRGHEDSIDGNAMALSNLEYHQQIDDLPTVRGVWFLDVGNAYDTVMDMEPGDLEAGTGFGLRWRIQKLVNVTLSADVGWGLGPGTPVFYLMTTGTF